jgi:mRNA-degrading endonuclease RelE of RelBE toxin-antitoxin system
MREYKTSSLFEKNIKRLKGKELGNLLSKIDEIISSTKLDHYKNLKHELKKFKRIHVNNSYIILFFDENQIIHFVDYEHHDKVYKFDKESLKKYKNLKF